MNNLINKAIKAIEEGKNEYAIGLLEGILEMNGINKANNVIISTGTRIMDNPMDYSNINMAAAAFTGNLGASGTSIQGDESAILDGMAAAKLAGIKAASNMEIA